jgi:hypothetical protein
VLVILYADNDDRAWREAGFALASSRFPEARIIIRNPHPYRSIEREAADAIVVQSQWSQIIADYVAAGVEVVTDYEVTGVEVVLDDAESIVLRDVETFHVEQPKRKRGRPRREEAECPSP